MVVGLWLLATPLALAQTFPIPPSGKYVVQTGDTLESIAQKFLGASTRWHELLGANPEITNPHFITPGSTIRIVPGQSINAKRATIQQVFRQVEQMPFPRPWTPASVGGILQERDGVRTFEKSSSELKFDNDSRMIVSEESVVFLREAHAHAREREPQVHRDPGRPGRPRREAGRERGRERFRVPHRRHRGNDPAGDRGQGGLESAAGQRRRQPDHGLRRRERGHGRGKDGGDSLREWASRSPRTGAPAGPRS